MSPISRLLTLRRRRRRRSRTRARLPTSSTSAGPHGRHPDPERGGQRLPRRRRRDPDQRSVGAETLDEALKTIIKSVDLAHIHPRDESSDHLHTPTWVASTHAQLGELLADYYSCELRDLSEVI
jgi:hypothetical protein